MYKTPYIFILYCIFINVNVYGQSDDENIVSNNISIATNDYYTISLPEDPDGFYEWFVNPGGGYGVELIVKDLKIDSKSNEYLLIKPEYNAKPEESLLFTSFLTKERKFVLLHLDDLYIKFFANSSDTSVQKDFKIYLKRLGEIPTTTEITTTEPPPTTLIPYENTTVYLKGKTHYDFAANISEPFKYELAYIATLFCKDNNITINENITVSDNVMYHAIGQCNINWVDSHLCTYINFSIAVNYNNYTNEYELTAKHLNQMWEEYAIFLNLSSYGLQIFSPPNDYGVVLAWVITSVCVTIIFFVVLCLIWRYDIFNEHIRKIYVDDDDDEFKNVNDEMFPTPYQSVPPLFGSDDYNENIIDNTWDIKKTIDYEKKPEESRGHESFAHDNESFEPDEEIIMSLEDAKKYASVRESSGNRIFMYESNL